MKKEKAGALYNPNYIDPASEATSYDKVAGVATNYGMNLEKLQSNDPYGMEPFADIKIGNGGGPVTRSNS